MSTSIADQLKTLVASGSLQTQPAAKPRMKVLVPKKAPVVAAEAEPKPVTVVAEEVPETVTPDVPATPVESAAPLDLKSKAREAVKAHLTLATKSFKGLSKLELTEVSASAEAIELTERRARRLSSALIELAKDSRDPAARSAREAGAWLCNASQTMREALASRDLTSEDISGVRVQARTKIDEINAFLVTPTTRVEAVRLEDLPAAYFNKYRRFASKLPSASDMTKRQLRFKTFRSPTLAIFSKPIRASELEADGFDVSDDGGYITFLDQHVWAVNWSLLQSSDTWDGDEENYLERLRAQYKRRTGETVRFIGGEDKQKVGHRSARGLGFYWAVTDREFRTLTHLQNGGFISEWNFPF